MPGDSYLGRAYALTSVPAARELYDKWASTYDAEMANETHEYVAPAAASRHLVDLLDADAIAKCKILDAGCGTGLVGQQLARAGASTIDGVDLSEGMLAVARNTGAYKNLSTADLSNTLDIQDGAYDAVICVGTLTQGHVGPGALRELVRVAKAEGYIVTTVLDKIWTSGGYEAEVDGLVKDEKAKLVSAKVENIVRGGDTRVRMVILQAVA